MRPLHLVSYFTPAPKPRRGKLFLRMGVLLVGVVGLVVMLDNWFQPAPLSDVAALRAQLEV